MGDRIVTDKTKLRVPSEPVDLTDPKTRFLARRVLTAATIGRNARGLAAPQIGVHRRMFHYSFARLGDVDGGVAVDRGGLTAVGIVCNPVLLETSEGSWAREEGCLSFPRQFILVERPVTAHFEWYDHHGERHETTLSGMAARVWLHELDHLDGVLMVDRAAPGTPLLRL